MNPKVQTFAQLATNTSGQLTNSYAEWTHFLETAARLYKYPYHEQVLIYAQRPEATACASYDVWNKRMGRGVRRGSKGIGLLSANGVRYVFDISDTVGRDGSRKPYLWEYREEHTDTVVTALAEQYGVTDEGGLPYQLEAIAQELAGEYWEQNWEDILASTPGSFLEDYDELNVEVEFRNAVTVSTTYALMSRCGLNPVDFFTHEDFLPVFDFNTPDSITALGTAVSGNSEQVLRQIEVTIKNYERTQRMERSGLFGERSELPAGRGLPAARIRGGNTIDFGEIRTDEGAVSSGGAPGAVQPSASQREADSAPDGDRPDGQPEVEADNAPAEGEHGPDGTDEGQRPHEVGGSDEQREIESGGDDTGRADLPITAPPAIDFSAVGPTGLQISHRELNSTVIPYFEDVSEKRELLIKSDALKKHQVEVSECFAAHRAPDERVQFVKNLFNNTYTEIILDNGQRVGYRAYDDCLHLWRGPYTDREQEEYLSWEDVSSAIEGMMQDGVWMEQGGPLEQQLTLEIGEPEKVTQDEDYIPNLFDLAGSTIPLTNEPVESTAMVRPGLSQNVIDAALTLGANDRNSRLRIIAEFMKDKPLEENARFLQAHYKKNGAGFFVGERKYSLWYDEAGMQIAPGESALTFTATALTWEQAAERIRVLLDEGRYASQSMLYRAWPFEKNRVAEALEYLHRDIGDEYKDKYLPALTAALSGTFGYPDVVDKTKELLEQPEQLKSVIDDFALFQRDYVHNRDILRFHFHRPDEIMLGLQDLQCTLREFTASPDFAPVERFFISQDEIDNLLREQPDRNDYRIGIYNFFEQHPDRKKREKYLGHLHGEYSGYHGGNDNITYTPKELTFTHGDIIEPYAAVKMKWSQVRKRIEELVKRDAFLSPEDREIMESRTLEKPSEEIDPLETAKSLIRKFRQSDRTSLDFSDLSKVLLTNAITENEKHGIQVFADLNNHRLLFEVNGQTVSTLQFHDVNDLNEHLEKLSAAELIDFAKEQYIINLNNEAPPKISEQDAKKHDILMANTKAHFASYEEVKQAHPGDIVLFQRGDFFEMYGPDARVASVELDIHLTNRNIPELGRVAMCGITAGSLDKSVEILRKKHGVTVSSLPEKGTERKTYSLPSFDSELDTAKKMIQDFCQQEYGSDADFSDLEHVSLAYTTTGNNEQEIQVEADLVHFVLTKYLDGQLCDEYHYNSLRELTEAELSGMSFDELVTLETNDATEITATSDSQSTQILDSTFNYRRLSQMKADCDYFLGAGNRAEKHLWQGNIHEHIGEMRRIYGLLPEKPEWLTMEEIDSYAQRMARRYQVVVYHTIVNGFDEMPEYQTLQQAQQIARDYVSGKMDEDGFQYEGAAVWDVQEHQWLFVEGYFPVLEGDKELPYLPYKPDEEPKQSQQEQEPTVRELYEKYKAEIITALGNDQPYRNACLNSDRETAYIEGDAAIKRVVLAAGDDTLTKLYFDNTKFHNDLHREALDETYPLFCQPEQALSEEVQPEQDTDTSARKEPTELQKKAIEIAKRYEKLPMEERISVIAQTFGCSSGKIETSPCTGKWRGTSDMSIRFDNGLTLFIGNESTPKSKTVKVQSEAVNRLLVWYNPEIVSITKESALAALRQREEKDNAIAAEKGLKPYTLLNVELHDGTHGKGSGYIGWYYVTLAVDGKIHAHLESGLNHEISFGKVSESPTRDKYFVAGALKETDVDYVFNNVGHSSTSDLYTMSISDEVRERAEKTLAERETRAGIGLPPESFPAAPAPYEPQDLPYIFCEWSESDVFQDKTAYSLAEFDQLMKERDSAYTEKQAEGVKLYGSWEKMYDSDDPEYMGYLGYEKVKFTLVLPDGRTFTERQDIGDGDGGVVDFLGKYDEYQDILPLLRETLEQYHDPLSLAYKAGDTVYLDNTAFTITDVGTSDVQLQDPTLENPVFRSESKEKFESLLCRDDRNSYITDYITYTDFGPMDDGGDLRDALTGEGGLLDEQEKAEISQRLRRGDGNADIAQHLQDKFDRTTESMTLETGETAGYSVNGPTFVLNLLDKSNTVRMYDLWTVAGVLRAMYQQELGGLRHELSVQERPAVEASPAPVQPEITAPPSTEPSNSPNFSTKTVAVYPAEKNNLPFDVVIETLHIDEPQRGPKAQNFHITDDNLGAGGAKAKYQMNMTALKTLHNIEAENRTATPEEQAVLSKYVGWGALADAFDETKTNWADEYKELLETLTPEEYESARASTLNSHYTSPTIIKAIYQALDNMGFHGGNILEPSCGVGNFFGLLPDSMSSSRLYGVELDGLTGRIAKQLYPHAHIEIKGYENTNFQNNSFDIAIGNVPFGQYQVFDPAYNKLGFSIHNYFFAKTIDKVRPGGIIAFVTSRYTMDSKSTQAREYMAQRAELLGAIRLPNNAFLSNAGTEVVTDILFLQKREQPVTTMSEWMFTEENADGFTINSYFIEHPEMILGEQSSTSTQYGGQDFTVNPFPSADLGELLSEAISYIDGHYVEAEIVQIEDEKEQEAIPADPAVKNFSYTIIKGDVYYRQDSVMVKMELGATAKSRTTALIDLRECTQRLISEQLDSYASDESIRHTQTELNRLYDNFSAKFGLINDKINERAFSQDSSYYLLCALEILDDEGKFVRKSDMFTKRTIYAHQQITHVDTAAEALAVSIGERARVDIPYMAELTGKTEDEIIGDLQGQIYPVPFRGQDGKPIYQTADEYLSGNVRKKLSLAQAAAASDPTYESNVDALTAALPRDLDASEISVRLGTDWIEPEYVEQFMYELLKTPRYALDSVHVQYSSQIKVWNISNKRIIPKNDVAAYSTYGTKRASAYELLESALNLKTARIYDIIRENGKDKRVFNAKETTLAQQKQEMMKLEFQNWIWKDPDRRQKLVRKYNDEMNCIRPRQYDGSHLVLAGMNPEIQLEEHQKNAIARAVYGGNTLFAHCVGAGKTFEITASAMEMKRLGLCSKSMIVVPNHLTQQWASEFLRLYPNANILVTTKRDFEKDRRKKFCSRIATGDYDAVIIGYSQFERIPISRERQIDLLYQQIDDIVEGIRRAKAENGERFSIKQLERTKKSLEVRLAKLQADNRKDDVVNFEELGIDRLFVDEADSFKNMFLYTKMRNVAGLSTSEAQKSSDMFNKTRYLDEITDYKGVIFATGTPISNSITEMYTMQRYLQYNALQAMNMEHFDSWASRFGETVTTMELAPEGTGYRPRTRFAKFFNLPELMNIFHEVADIKTEDMLNLPTPDVEFHNIVAKPTEFQKAYVQDLSERATAVRVGDVEPTEDNLLKITNDGRKLGLDQRLISPLAEDESASKLNLCVDNIMQFWEEGKEDMLTQLVFSDLSTPKKDGSFNVYDDIKRKLMERGVPETEVAFIHDADTEVKKKELFAKVRSGKVRVLIGSTQKLGAGTNVQDRLIALHHLDCPWRPRDLTQREGRIIRRGNNNPLVHVFRYATEGTFDSYLWQTVEKKQQFIGQIMTSKSPARTCEDVDEAALSYAEVKALCAGDPRIKERMELDVEVAKLQVMQASHRSQQYDLEDKIRLYFPQERRRLEWRVEGIQIDISTLAEHPLPVEGYIGIELLGQHFDKRKTAGIVLLNECKSVKVYTTVPVGKYRGLEVLVKRQNLLSEPQIILKGAVEYAFYANNSDIGNITRIDNALERLPEELAKAQASLENVKQQFESAKQEVGKPFPQEQELKDKLARITELDIALKMNDNQATAEVPAMADEIAR